jgi:hypothetical protein
MRLHATSLSPGRITSIAWGMITASMLVGFLTRIAFLARYVDFRGDEARDAYVYAAMRHAPWPVLGAYIGADYPDDFWRLPPLYYYIVFPFARLGYDPTFAALSSGTFSFLTIPLLICMLYRLLNGLSHSRRLVYAALGGLWWSVMINDVVLATRAWNPSPTIFFTLLFVILAAGQIKSRIIGCTAAVAWALLGVLLAVLVSLHGIVLYVMTVVFVIFSIIFVTRAQRRLWACMLVFI